MKQYGSFLNKNAIIAPFDKSISNVTSAIHLFLVQRNAFVAPVLPEPQYLKSKLQNFLDNIYPGDNAPIK